MKELSQDEKNELKQNILNDLKVYIDRHCIFRANPKIQYVEDLDYGRIPGKGPGKGNAWQFFLRRATHDYMALQKIILLFGLDLYDKLASQEIDRFQFCGLETGSIPLITGMQMLLAGDKIGVNAFTIRKKRKSYGIFNFIEGNPTEAPALIFDDLCNSGSSVYRAIETASTELNLPIVNFMYCVVNLNNSDEIEILPGQKIKVISLFRKEDFDFTFDESKYWEPKDIDKSYNKRPEYR